MTWLDLKKYYVQRKKTDTKEYLLYGSIFMKFKNRDDSAVVDIILVADSGGGTCIPLSPTDRLERDRRKILRDENAVYHNWSGSYSFENSSSCTY